MEHSGTTLLSQLLHAHPQVASGAECGILLSKLHEFDRLDPFWGWMAARHSWGWGLNEDDRQALLGAQSYEEAYGILAVNKGKNTLDPDLRRLFLASDIIYDKTPAYVFQLANVLTKIDVPCCVVVKSWREIYDSYCRKRSWEIKKTALRYERMLDQVIAAKGLFGARVLVILYRQLAKGNPAIMRAVADHFRLPGNFELSLANYNDRFGKYTGVWSAMDKSSLFYEESDHVAPHVIVANTSPIILKYEIYFRAKFELATLDSIKTL